ncbi:MAG: hypothetical protein ACE3L7_01710 [Candidatus Pristimantibacillus sp.]
MDINYTDVVTELKRSFPEGTVQFRTDNNRPYIPNQVYTDRLETATGSRWDREIKELEINVPFRYVKAIVRIHIEQHFRDGYGFSPIDGEPSSDPRKITTAVDKAVNEAILEALDSYEMGWRDLAPHKIKDWAGNPALRHLMEGDVPQGNLSDVTATQSFAKLHHSCIQCGSHLTEMEWSLLGQVPNLNRDVMKYCFKHLPKHLKRKLPEHTLTKYESLLGSQTESSNS